MNKPDSFIVGVPGINANEAFKFAISVSIKEKSCVPIEGKHSFILWEKDIFNSYNEACSAATEIINHGFDDHLFKCKKAMCVKYLNVSNDTEYLFFGWKNDDDYDVEEFYGF